MNQGIHQVDLLAWFMGDPVAVTAHALTLQREIEVEDTVSASLRFAGGALAAINATVTAAPGFPPRMEIYGTRGGVQVEGDTLMHWWSEASLPQGESSLAQPASAGAGADPRGISTAGHIAIISDFIQALHENRPPLVDGAEGRRSLAIVISIYQAAGRIPSAA
jgi:predicted dehydrogenase